MAKILSAHFPTPEAASSAIEALQQMGFARGHIAEFHVNAPGQHDIEPPASYFTGGTDHDPNAANTDRGALRGAAAGATAGAVIGGVAAAALMPGIVVLLTLGTAAAGAYTGSLVGAMSSTPADTRPAVPTGLRVAVRLDDASRAAEAADCLRAHGGVDVGEADGILQDGDWVDYDPTIAPRA